MKILLMLTALIGLSSMTTGQTQARTSLEPDPIPWTASPHQAAATGNLISPIEPDLGTPGAQAAAEPPEDRVSPFLFGDFPATVHQASLGLSQSSVY
jgi:hypothetical protein